MKEHLLKKLPSIASGGSTAARGCETFGRRCFFSGHERSKSSNYFGAKNVFDANKHFGAKKQIWCQQMFWRQQMFLRQHKFWRQKHFWRQICFWQNQFPIGVRESHAAALESEKTSCLGLCFALPSFEPRIILMDFRKL